MINPGSAMNVSEEAKISDIQHKIEIMQNIIGGCNNLGLNPDKTDSPLATTIALTGETSESIKEAEKYAKVEDLNKLVEKYKRLQTRTKDAQISSSDIINILSSYYVDRRQIPNLGSQCKELDKFQIFQFQIDVLKSRGFIWKTLSNDKCLLMEDPEVQAKRVKYLLDMKRFRDEDRTFVYIDEKAIPADTTSLCSFQSQNFYPGSGTYQMVKIAASPKLRLISLSINKPSETITDWLSSEVFPHVEPSYVVVIPENILTEKAIKEPPKPEAKKEEMLEWLERNNIPCEPTMHRADLYELIEMFKDKNDRNHETDELFKEKGVEVLKIPEGWPKLNYFHKFWSTAALWLNVDDRPKDKFAQTIAKRVELTANTYSTAYWGQDNHKLSLIENDVFERDMEIEEVIDKLLTMAKYNDLPYADLPYSWEVQPSYFEALLSLFGET